MPQYTVSPVTVSHTGSPSPTSASHVEDGSTTPKSHVDNLHPASANHVGGTIIFSMDHINATSLTHVHHVGDGALTSTSHVESTSLVVVNDIGGIEKPRRIRRKPKFLCRTCEGDHITHLCPATAKIPEAWGSPNGPTNSEACVVSPHLVPPLIDTVVTSLQSSPDLIPIVEGDVSPIPIDVHPLQPRIEEVIIPV
jgi:hypothetical protein